MVVIAASALRGVQETLVLATPGAELRTASGKWEVTWNGFEMRKTACYRATYEPSPTVFVQGRKRIDLGGEE